MDPRSASAEPAPADALRRWLAATLGEVVVDQAEHSTAELIFATEYEGLVPLLDWKLRETSSLFAPEGFREELAVRARDEVARSLFSTHEIARIAGVLDSQGFRTLLLKGHAFARWLYPKPYLRVCGDIDLLFESREEANRAATALQSLGYALAFLPGSLTYEMSCRLMVDGQLLSELDLHCRLVNQQIYAERLGFDELWTASMSLAGLPASVRGLSPEHALLHACLHRAHDMGLRRPDRLKWLYDIHLLMARMDAAAWNAFTLLAQAKGLCGICLRSLQDAREWFGARLPADAAETMAHAAQAEQLDARRIDDWRYIQWQGFKALPGMRARLRWLYERLLPTRSHLQELHGEDAPWLVLLFRRVGRGFWRMRNRE
ncbi:nucleotidyltransferase family protein [Lysobacter tyrosinilyticus]